MGSVQILISGTLLYSIVRPLPYFYTMELDPTEICLVFISFVLQGFFFCPIV